MMNTIKQLLAITGSALIIASCGESEASKDDAADSTSTSTTNSDMATTGTDATGSSTSTAKYVDLKTGQPTELYYDKEKDMTYSSVSNEPVDLYVNVATGDTIYGTGRYVVNNYVIKAPDGTYKLDEGKLKIKKGEIKIKDGDRKLKIEDGEMKIKDGKEKMKVDADEMKLKTDSGKMKTEDGHTKEKH
jgi:hypothetical protein